MIRGQLDIDDDAFTDLAWNKENHFGEREPTHHGTLHFALLRFLAWFLLVPHSHLPGLSLDRRLGYESVWAESRHPVYDSFGSLYLWFFFNLNFGFREARQWDP